MAGQAVSPAAHASGAAAGRCSRRGCACARRPRPRAARPSRQGAGGGAHLS
jgi:hypothetical protein